MHARDSVLQPLPQEWAVYFKNSPAVQYEQAGAEVEEYAPFSQDEQIEAAAPAYFPAVHARQELEST